MPLSKYKNMHKEDLINKCRDLEIECKEAHQSRQQVKTQLLETQKLLKTHQNTPKGKVIFKRRFGEFTEDELYEIEKVFDRTAERAVTGVAELTQKMFMHESSQPILKEVHDATMDAWKKYRTISKKARKQANSIRCNT